MTSTFRAALALTGLLAVLEGACRRETSRLPPSGPPPASSSVAHAEPVGAPTGAAAPSGAGPTAFSLPKLPLPVPATAGPLRVRGYPSPLNTGMSDPAESFGFTRDGEKIAHCSFDICCATENFECRLVGRDGKEEVRSSFSMADSGTTPTTLAALRAFVRDEDLQTLGAPREMTRLPPPVRGSFAYGGDFIVLAAEIAPTVGKDGIVIVPGSVKLGAQIPGESPVWVFFPKRPPECTKTPEMCMEAQVNGISLSPKSDELAVFVYTRLPSHGSIIRGERIDVADFSSRVFNDTGLAHHRKKEWAKAIELFTRAVYADPRRELPAYNLACALARAGDPRAEEALRYAITLGGDTVRARAAKERDFEGVRSTPWYGALTKP